MSQENKIPFEMAWVMAHAYDDALYTQHHTAGEADIASRRAARTYLCSLMGAVGLGATSVELLYDMPPTGEVTTDMRFYKVDLLLFAEATDYKPTSTLNIDIAGRVWGRLMRDETIRASILRPDADDIRPSLWDPRNSVKLSDLDVMMQKFDKDLALNGGRKLDAPARLIGMGWGSGIVKFCKAFIAYQHKLALADQDKV